MSVMSACTTWIASTPYLTDESRWEAVRTRDREADGHFVYAVRTTGVYCRPSSSARLPRRENVQFFNTPQEAEAAGFRPSRRSSADRSAAAVQRSALVARACRWIETAESEPGLAALAKQVGISAYHFHRLFKAETGLSPKAYASAYRAERLRKQLAEAPTITQAIYEAGFNSNSRFYAASDCLLGMKPKDYKAGGVNNDICFAVGQCSLGAILVARSQRGICAIWLGDDPDKLVRDLQDRFPLAQMRGDDSDFSSWVAQVIGYVEAPAVGLNLPLDIRGTAFQQRVWQALKDIPLGATTSYAQIAERIGAPTAVRAVAQACGANQLAVAIPCHRVVRQDGDLSGYRWGVDRKRKLLHREAINMKPPEA